MDIFICVVGTNQNFSGCIRQSGRNPWIETSKYPEYHVRHWAKDFWRNTFCCLTRLHLDLVLVYPLGYPLLRRHWKQQQKTWRYFFCRPLKQTNMKILCISFTIHHNSSLCTYEQCGLEVASAVSGVTMSVRSTKQMILRDTLREIVEWVANTWKSVLWLAHTSHGYYHCIGILPKYSYFIKE